MLRIVPYALNRYRICSGDLLFSRARWRPSSRLIARGSGYSHVGMAIWWHDVLFLVHTVQFRGGEAIRLSAAVAAHPGRWDVRRVPDLVPGPAIDVMLRAVGTPYGWRSLGAAAARQLPVVGRLFRPLTDDRLNGSFPHCAQLGSRALRASGKDPLPGVADVLTEPGDLAGDFSEYLFTLGGET